MTKNHWMPRLEAVAVLLIATLTISALIEVRRAPHAIQQLDARVAWHKQRVLEDILRFEKDRIRNQTSGHPSESMESYYQESIESHRESGREAMTEREAIESWQPLFSTGFWIGCGTLVALVALLGLRRRRAGPSPESTPLPWIRLGAIGALLSTLIPGALSVRWPDGENTAVLGAWAGAALYALIGGIWLRSMRGHNLGPWFAGGGLWLLTFGHTFFRGIMLWDTDVPELFDKAGQTTVLGVPFAVLGTMVVVALVGARLRRTGAEGTPSESPLDRPQGHEA